MTVTEKVAYLKGLAEGLDLDKNDNTVKLVNAIIDTLGEIAESMSELELDIVDISDQVDAVDEDLAEVEEYLYEPQEEEDDFYEVKCPECGETMVVDFDTLNNDEVFCANCNAQLHLDFEDNEDSIDF